MTVEEAFFRGFLATTRRARPVEHLVALSHFSYGLPFMIVGVFAISLIIASAIAGDGNDGQAANDQPVRPRHDAMQRCRTG